MLIVHKSVNKEYFHVLIILWNPQVLHYVEKPETFVSDIINCGLYIFSPSIFKHMGEILQRNYEQARLVLGN